jgi:hypothetical protein
MYKNFGILSKIRKISLKKCLILYYNEMLISVLHEIKNHKHIFKNYYFNIYIK